MKGKVLIGLFFCLAAVQIITPLAMIRGQEVVLKEGAPFKFKTAPVDPFDAFRGRYVALRLEQDTVPRPGGLFLSEGQTAYAVLGVDDQGFAVLTDVLTQRPAGVPYIQAKVNYCAADKIQLDLGIDRYYMGEKAAPVAERLAWQRLRRGVRDEQDTYAVVRVKDGRAVLEALYVAGRPIEDAVREELQKQT